LYRHWGKVKCTLVQALRLYTGRTAHRGSRGIALSFHDHCTRRGWVVSVTPQPLFNPGKDTFPIVQEAGWAPGPVWTGVKNLVHTRIRSPDRPARSQSLYRLSYPAHINVGISQFFLTQAPNKITVSTWEVHFIPSLDILRQKRFLSLFYVLLYSVHLPFGAQITIPSLCNFVNPPTTVCFFSTSVSLGTLTLTMTVS
jgi:hypothetical protein